MSQADVNSVLIATFVPVLSIVVAYVISRVSNTKALSDRVNDLTTRTFALQDSALDCQKRESDLKAELASVTGRLRIVEAGTGIAPPSLAGVIVCDLRGVVRVFSPSLSPFLKYLPKEIQGRNVSELAPPETVGEWSAELARATADPAGSDPMREVLTYLMAKDGARVPVVAVFEGWGGDDGHVTITVRRRSSGPVDPGESGRFPART